jgi:chromosome partitioning protein
VAKIRLIIPTMYDPRRRVSKQVIKLLRELGPRLARPIRVDARLSEAPGYGKTIFEYAARSRGAEDYARLTEYVAAMPLVGLSDDNQNPGNEDRQER